MKANDSKKLKEVLTSGTPKQKAALICASLDAEREGGKPTLTESEVRAIYDSLKDPADGKEFNNWLKIREKIIDTLPMVLMQSLETQAAANDLMAHIKTWEAYNREIDHLNALCFFVEDEAPKKLLQPFKDKISRLCFTHASVERAADGYFTLNIDGKGQLYEIILYKAEVCEQKLSFLKAILTAFENFVSRKKAKAFVPRVYEQEVSKAKQDLGEQIAPYYSKHKLNELRKKGYDITPIEEKRAVFPDYDEVEIYKEYYDLTIDRLNS